MHLRSEIVDKTLCPLAGEEHTGQGGKTNFLDLVSHEDMCFDLEYHVFAGSNGELIRPSSTRAIQQRVEGEFGGIGRGFFEPEFAEAGKFFRLEQPRVNGQSARRQAIVLMLA